MVMFHRVIKVEPKENYKLLVFFEKGQCKIYDVQKLFDKYQDFNILKNGLFKNVSVDIGGYGVSWNDDIDLSCDELYYNGENILQIPSEDIEK